MELIFLCSLLLFILAISLYYFSNFNPSANLALPPGRTGWPLVGESIEFLSNLQNGNVEKFMFKRMAKYSPEVFKTSIVGDQVAVLCGPKGNKFVFSEGNKLVNRWVRKSLEMMLGPAEELEMSFNQYIRPEFHSFFKLDSLRNFVGTMDTVAQQHLQSHWHGVQEVMVYPSAKRYAFALACRLLLSVEDPDVVESMFDPMETFALGLTTVPIDLPGTRLNQSLKAGAVLRSQIQKIVVRLQRSTESSPSCNTKSYLSCIIQACEDSDSDNVTSVVIALLLAGHATIASVLSMMLKVLTNDPDIYRRVYEENMKIGTQGELLTFEDTQKMKYTWNVAREVMRLYPPIAFLTRTAMSDFKYAGYNIPKGYKLITIIAATHKDPKYFPDPLKFDPSRFDGNGPLPYTYLPFGGGPQMCPGMNYAQIEILVFIHNVVKNFKWKAKIADEKVVGIPFPRPAQDLPIILHPHNNN